MNKIDREFYHLIDILKNSTREQLLFQMKENFKLIPEEIQRSIEDYFKKFDYWGKLDFKNNEFEELERKVDSFTNHLDDYIWLYEHLNDYRSKKLLLAIMRNWYQYDFITLKETMESMYPDYFDLDIVKPDENEVIVDLGAYIGDTIYSYLDTYGEENYKRISVSDKSEKLYIEESSVDASANTVKEKGEIYIDAVTLDEDIEDEITMIKMDIEAMGKH